jgi:predicted transcriptional regulator
VSDIRLIDSVGNKTFTTAKMEWLDCAAFKLKPVDFKVAFVVMQYVNEKTGECYPGVETIARKCGLSERHVKRALKRLCDSGWLERTRRPNTSNVYAPLNKGLNHVLDERASLELH